MGLLIGKDTIYEDGAIKKTEEKKKAEAAKKAEPVRKPVKKTARKAADEGEKNHVDSLV